MSKIRNKDCLNCAHSDCINDRLDHEDYTDNAVDNINFPPGRQAFMNRERCNRYARKNREKIREKSLAYYYLHREDQNKRSRTWQQENKDRVAAAKRRRYAENPEYYREKQREYRRKRKDQQCKSKPTALNA